MQITKSKIRYECVTISFVVGLFVWALCCADVATAGSYADSAHGDISYGVNRSGAGFTIGYCAHCHDAGGADACTNELMFFAPNDSTSQTDNFCFECHKDPTDSVQTGMPEQYSYSYRASGDPSIVCPGAVLEAFSFIDGSGDSVLNCDSAYGTSHKLADIKSFIAGKWGYTADSNPCTACHNPHLAQRDPHTAGERGLPDSLRSVVSLPSAHTNTSTWELWGDASDERMNQYAIDQGGTYQAPNAASGFEPDGSTTQDGSNLTDYVTFCTDCHNSTNSIFSTVLGRALRTIDWDTEKHGRGAASDDAQNPDVLSPYEDSLCGKYILACTDCHEAHGAPNIFLTRQKVNSGEVSVLTGTGPDDRPKKEWVKLCGKCHNGLAALDGIHPHPYTFSCATCHPNVFDLENYYRPCGDCHYHGNSKIDGADYGEPLF